MVWSGRTKNNRHETFYFTSHGKKTLRKNSMSRGSWSALSIAGTSASTPRRAARSAKSGTKNASRCTCATGTSCSLTPDAFSVARHFRRTHPRSTKGQSCCAATSSIAARMTASPVGPRMMARSSPMQSFDGSPQGLYKTASYHGAPKTFSTARSCCCMRVP